MERGHTQVAIAAAAGISVTFVNDMEHDRTNPSLDTLVRLAIAYDVQAVDVLRGVPPYDLDSSA